MEKIKLKIVLNSDIVTIYSPLLQGETYTEFEKFLLKYRKENDSYVKEDFDKIMSLIKKILTRGAFENLFRPEGRFQDNVVALPLLASRRKRDAPRLRLYCIRISDNILILGNGAVKTTKTYNQDPVLSNYVKQLQIIDKKLKDKITIGDIEESDNMLKPVEGDTIIL